MEVALVFDISVIISNFNGEAYLEKLLATLERQVDVELQIIVVDRESTDNSLSILERYPKVLVSSYPPEAGLVAGYHHGFTYAKYDLIFFCNEDMWLDDFCLYNLAKNINLDQGILSTDPWQWTYDGRHLIHAGVGFVKSFTVYGLTQPIPFYISDFMRNLNEGDRIAYACAGACLVHKQAYINTGGWDTTFFLDVEDVDFYCRYFLKGYKVVTVPSAKVFHAVSSSTSKIVKKIPVKKKRYISDASNKFAVTIKYLPFFYIFYHLFFILILIVARLILFKWRFVKYEFSAFGLTISRLPFLFAERRKFQKQRSVLLRYFISDFLISNKKSILFLLYLFRF